MADMFSGQTQQLSPNNAVPQYTGSTPYGYGSVNPYGQYQNWGNPYGQYQNWNPVQQTTTAPVQQTQQQSQQDDGREYVLIPTSVPNKMRKYVFVGEVDMQTNMVTPPPSFNLEDIRKTIAHEFDVRFGDDKK